MNLFKVIKPWLISHEPEILMSMGISGMIFSTIWGVKATVAATRIVDKKKEELNVDKLEFREVVKDTWKLYIPVVASAAISVPCIISGNRISSKRTAALAAAYTISETAFKEYMDKTTEIVGAKKASEIREATSKETVETKNANAPIIITGDGDSLFYEPLSGRYFKSNWNKILKSANELNMDTMKDPFSGYILLNDWFYVLNLEDTDMGQILGWKPDDGLLDISVDSHVTPDGVPCGAIFYNSRPSVIE